MDERSSLEWRTTMQKYRDYLNADEQAALLADIEALDRAYQTACNAGADRDTLNEQTDEDMRALVEASIEGSLEYFNRYIAGDH
jgi:hypothetical protein